jgi:branched-subunit amino acid transport protein AzlD
MTNTISTVAVILVVAVCTFLTRVFPFLIFGGKREVPKWVSLLGKSLPPTIIATLVIYCLKEINIFYGNHGLPELISVSVVILLHVWKKNTLLSILAGTAIYMILIQFVFVSQTF